MNTLLATILDAHGGLERWTQYTRVDATLISGGGFFALKGVVQDAQPRRMSVWLHEERAMVSNYGAPDQLATYSPGRVSVERVDGTVIAERFSPRDSFSGHQMHTAWDPLHRAYFNGEALWTYLSTPFLLALEHVRVEEIEPWQADSETWHCLRAHFPSAIETHSQVQEFFFGPDLLLRRHDYRVNIAGGFEASQLTSDYIEAGGIRLPSRRRAYTRGPARSTVLDMQMVRIDLSDVSFT